MTNQPNLSNQPSQICPYCEGVGRLSNGYLCPACNGFKRVGEIGMRRARLYQAWDKKRERGELPPPDFNTDDCYF